MGNVAQAASPAQPAEPSTVEGTKWAAIPEWLLDAKISDRAVRLYAILARHADASSSTAIPRRRKLAERLDCALSTLDLALSELVQVQAVEVIARYRADGSRSSSAYRLFFDPPGYIRSAPPDDSEGGSTGSSVGVARPAGQQEERQPYNDSHRNDRTPRVEALLPIGQVNGSLVDGDADQSVAFESFWQAYPRRTAKGQARKAWPAALRKLDGDAQRIIDAAARFAGDPNRDDRYTPHPATWLNGERWDDPPLPPRSGPTARQQATRPTQDRAGRSGALRPDEL